jgi:hypothetical protein
MALFVPDKVDASDPIGFGYWLNGHYYEHQQFINIGIRQTNPIYFVNFDLLSWDARFPETWVAWLGAHQQMHESLRGVTGVGGIELSSVDPTNAQEFQVWMQWHATEHQNLRTAFGVS